MILEKQQWQIVCKKKKNRGKPINTEDCIYFVVIYQNDVIYNLFLQ